MLQRELFAECVVTPCEVKVEKCSASTFQWSFDHEDRTVFTFTVARVEEADPGGYACGAVRKRSREAGASGDAATATVLETSPEGEAG